MVQLISSVNTQYIQVDIVDSYVLGVIQVDIIYCYVLGVPKQERWYQTLASFVGTDRSGQAPGQEGGTEPYWRQVVALLQQLCSSGKPTSPSSSILSSLKLTLPFCNESIRNTTISSNEAEYRHLGHRVLKHQHLPMSPIIYLLLNSPHLLNQPINTLLRWKH